MSDVRFTRDDERVLYHSGLEDMKAWLDRGEDPPAMESAGPREMLFFDPSRLACGIVTCGGICPGLNDVIRAIVLSLHHHYGVDKIYGFRFGYEGLVRRYGHEPLELTPDAVKRIHEMRRIGPGLLPRAPGPGGDGRDPGGPEDRHPVRHRRRRDAPRRAGDQRRSGGGGASTISVIGIPKTIDNDISFVQQTFGFETAVTEARRATYAANSEAEAARNGIGLVKLMGRDSGFIAAFSVLVDSQVNFCLVPEVPFTLERFLSVLEQRIERRGHAVIVVAEGAGQDLMAPTQGRDASGNVRYGDIGVFLRDTIKEHFKRIGMEISLKYIDPSYTIRSVPASPHDSAFCLLLGHCAVHAGMSGRTNMVVSFWNSPVHPCAHLPGRVRAQEDRPRGTALERRPRVDGAAAGHASARAASARRRGYGSSKSERPSRLREQSPRLERWLRPPAAARRVGQLLAGPAALGERHRPQARLRDRSTAVAAHPVLAALQPLERELDALQRPRENVDGGRRDVGARVVGAERLDPVHVHPIAHVRGRAQLVQARRELRAQLAAKVLEHREVRGSRARHLMSRTKRSRHGPLPSSSLSRHGHAKQHTCQGGWLASVSGRWPTRCRTRALSCKSCRVT